MTKTSVSGIVLGGLLAGMIACGGSAKSSMKAMPAPTSADAGGMAQADRHQEIENFDREISDEMAKLGLTRPPAPPATCTSDCAQAMSTAAQGTTQETADCKPAKSTTCTESCTLKGSICENAGRICNIAAQLGGGDAWANDKCNSGTASCDAAKKRCCECM